MNQTIVRLESKIIHDKIYSVRGMQVMLDRDLAELYQVKTKVFNQAIKRNIERFPSLKFRFQLTTEEYHHLRSQIVTSSLEKHGGRRYLPYAFTEQGVAMLSAILKSQVAIQISIQIMEAFVNMRKFLTQNAMIFQKFDYIEQKLFGHDQDINKIFKTIESKEIQPKQGIFFEGQIFDTYVFISKLIKQAKQSIILIDNYIDESVLTLLSKRSKNCTAIIYTKTISKKLALDLKKHNEQYLPIKIKTFQHAHDRFMMLDNVEIYHIGASLKDLGKKWFAFSKFDKKALEFFERLNNDK